MSIHNYKIILVVVCILALIIILYCLNKNMNMDKSAELFQDINTVNPNLFNNPRYEKDRTQLYGSLFLDKLNEQIKNLTDPRIQYDTKRIDIIKYSDVLL